MDNIQALELLKEFQITWPVERIKNLTLDEYTNSDKDTAFTYWIEKKTEKLAIPFRK